MKYQVHAQAAFVPVKSLLILIGSIGTVDGLYILLLLLCVLRCATWLSSLQRARCVGIIITGKLKEKEEDTLTAYCRALSRFSCLMC